MAIDLLEFLHGLSDDGFDLGTRAEQLVSRFSRPHVLLSFLVKEDLVPREELAARWADLIDIPWVDLTKTLFQKEALARFNQPFCSQHNCIPLYMIGNVITLAMEDPTDLLTIEEAERLSACHISPVFALSVEVEDAIAVQFASGDSMDQLLANIDLSEFATGADASDRDQEEGVNHEKIVELASAILLWGLRERASDIHIEPQEYDVALRFRVDGVMQRRMDIDRTLLRALTARLKVLAGVDIMEKRRPLDGRIALPLRNNSIDYRFSSVPSLYGEKIVLRVLGQSDKLHIPDLTELDLSRRNHSWLQRVVQEPNGIFFVTGPTGSGKSTTLFSLLKAMDKEALNIMTVENPVEYRLKGITQIGIAPEVGLTFATALRSLLRQDPDVILVGEIRDVESAQVAAEAALTGHLVLSTLHTNDALQAITRLIEIGVEPFLVAPAVIGVLSQRLVRRLCTSCRAPYVLSKAEFHRLFDAESYEEVRVYRARGCVNCSDTGYVGRAGIHELMFLDDGMRTLITQDAPVMKLETYARRRGFEDIRYDGVKKVLRGLTSLDELDRVTSAEGLT